MPEKERLAFRGVASLLQQLLRHRETLLLRVSLGTVFLWFGLLKIFGETSVLGIIRSAYPFVARAPFLQTLGLGETVLGVGVLVGWRVRFMASIMFLHLVGTLLVPVLAPATAFDPGFPILTLEGEFVVKNLVLVSAALVLTKKT